MSDIFDHEMEAWDRREAGEEDEHGGYKDLKCKYCGKNTNLRWCFIDFKWRLVDTLLKSVHTCKEYKKNE